jgi:hypothetical protein
MVRAVRAPIQRTRAATEIPARQTIARAVRALRCALAESNSKVHRTGLQDVEKSRHENVDDLCL